MTDEQKSGLAMGASLVVMLFIIALALAFYIFMCYCYKRICEKTGRKPGALVWIPIVHFIPLLQIARMPEWMVILLLVPIANFVVFVMLWAKICTALGKSPWLVIMIFVPLVNLVFIPYLAFSESPPQIAPPPPPTPAIP
jgi:hypothetical protein